MDCINELTSPSIHHHSPWDTWPWSRSFLFTNSCWTQYDEGAVFLVWLRLGGCVDVATRTVVLL